MSLHVITCFQTKFLSSRDTHLTCEASRLVGLFIGTWGHRIIIHAWAHHAMFHTWGRNIIFRQDGAG